jgi:uncharacterized protein YcgL (UPF0745 family)
VGTPLVAYFISSSGLSQETEKKKEHMSSVLYARAVRSIMYVIVYTHLDISHVVSVVNKFIGNPSIVH